MEDSALEAIYFTSVAAKAKPSIEISKYPLTDVVSPLNVRAKRFLISHLQSSLRSSLTQKHIEIAENLLQRMKDTHHCAFNDGDEHCICYRDALIDFIKKLHTTFGFIPA